MAGRGRGINGAAVRVVGADRDVELMGGDQESANRCDSDFRTCSQGGDRLLCQIRPRGELIAEIGAGGLRPSDQLRALMRLGTKRARIVRPLDQAEPSYGELIPGFPPLW